MIRILGRILKGFLLVLVFCVSFFIFNNGKFVYGIKVEDVKQEVFDNYQEITSIELNLDLSEVVIESTDKPMIEVDYPVFKDKDLQIQVSQEGDKLRIAQESHKNVLNISWPSLDSKQTKTTIRIPKDYTLENLDLDLSMGSLEIQDINAEHCNILLSMGSLSASQALLGAVEAKLSMGSVDFQEVELAGDSDFELSIGSFEGSMKVVRGQVRMDVSMGSVDLDMYDGHYQYKTNASMGDVNLKDSANEQAHGDYNAVLDLNVSMGDITVY